jgi:hypothetical protein
MLIFSLFALLPLALASLFDRTRARSTAGFGFLAALAPVLASGVSKIIGSKQKKSAEKQAEAQRKLEAEQEDKLARQQWETEMNSPSAQMSRFKNTFSLGKLAGKVGGLDKLPPSIRNYYQTQRTKPEYGGVSSYVPTAQKGGGGWDFLGGLTDALSYFDPQALKKPKTGGGLSGFGTGSSFTAPPAAAQPSTSPLVGLTERLKAGGLANPTYPPRG